MLKIVVKKVNELGNLVEIEDTLDNWQRIVGGWIETYPLTDSILIVLNEEGKLKGLTPNIGVPVTSSHTEVIVGDIAFVSYDREGNFKSLSDDDIDYLRVLNVISEDA